MAKDRLSGKLVVILHADVAGSTVLVQQDKQLAHERIQDSFQRFSDTIKKYQGKVLELRGDALLAEFEHAYDAVSAALSFQVDHAYYIDRLKDNLRPTLRVGIAMGEVIIADRTVTGAGVVQAQRVEQLADPGGVFVTAAIQEALSKTMPLDLENLGEKSLKGFDFPVRVFRVKLRLGKSIPPPGEGRQHDATPKSRRLIVGVVTIVLVVMVGTAYWFKSRVPQAESASLERMTLPLPDKPSIAVLPFDNLSGDSKQEYFSDGITNDIITDLSKFSGLFVISSNSTFTYKGKPVKVQQVAEELGVRYVLEGSVQRLGDQIRINAQLIDAPSGRHLWAERYERDTEDLFAVQTEIIEMIVATLAFRIEEVERERALHKDTKSLAAYDYYLLARKAFLVFTKESMTEARNLFETAIELDPNYARAYAYLSGVHANLYINNWTEDADRSQEIALEMARKAVTLSPEDYYSHWALGYVYQRNRDFDRAMAGYERALELNSNDANLLARMVGILVHTGRAEDGVVQSKLAMRINPHYPDWYLWNLGWAQYFTGEYEEALASLKRMSNLPNGARTILAAVLVRLGRIEEARAVIAAFREQEPDFTLATMEQRHTFQNRTYIERFMEDLRTAGLPEKPSIAVLPFTNMSSDAEQEYFADGMTEDLITDISKISGLQVIARHSTFSYKGQNPDVRNVGKELGATHVIEGSVRKAGSTVRITIQLIDASDGKHVWAERYDRELRDVFAIQDEVIGEIITALSLRLTPDEAKRVAKHDTENLEAYDMFMRGREQEAFFTKESFVEAQKFYEQAVALDINYAEAWARLAQIHALNGQFGWVDNFFAANQRALSLVEKSLDLDPDSSFIRYGYSRILARESIGQHDRAIEEAKKAIELDPNFADAYAWLGQLYILTGQAQKTPSQITVAMRINPNFPFWYDYTFGYAHYFMGEFGKAAEYIELAVDRNPNVYFTRLAYAASLAMAGNQDDAEWQIDELFGMGFDKTREELIQEHPIRDLTYRKLYDEGLQKAGLP